MTHFTLKTLMSLAGFAATSSAIPNSLHAQQINIHLTFYEEYDEISPRPGVRSRYEEDDLQLSANGVVSGSVDYNVTLRSYHSGTSSKSVNSKLGASSGYEWKVAGKDKLINIVDNGGFRRAILLTVNGSTCSAQVDFQLKPGFSDFEYIHKDGSPPTIRRSIVAKGLSCSVS